MLAKQLGDARAELHKARSASSKLASKLQAETAARSDAEGAAEALQQRLEKLLNGSQAANKQRSEMAEVRVLCIHVDLCTCALVCQCSLCACAATVSVSCCLVVLPDVHVCPYTFHTCVCVQQLAAAQSEVSGLKAEKDELSEVVLEMQVGALVCMCI